MTTTQQLRARGLAHLGLWSAYPGRTHPGRLRWVPAVVGLALVLVAWFAVTATGAVDPLYLPGPLDVAARMAEQAQAAGMAGGAPGMGAGGMPGMGHSGAARSGMDNLTKTAAFEWGYAGVRVNAVAPGWIASSGMDTYEGAFKAVIPTLREHVPLKRDRKSVV